MKYAWQTVVLTPNGNREFRGIGIVDRGTCPIIEENSKAFYTNYDYQILSFRYNDELQKVLEKKLVKLARFCIRISRFFLVSGFC